MSWTAGTPQRIGHAIVSYKALLYNSSWHSQTRNKLNTIIVNVNNSKPGRGCDVITGVVSVACELQ